MNFVQKLKVKLDQNKLLYKLSCWLNNHNAMICSFMVPLLIYWLMFILRGVYPFGEDSVLVLDLNGQYVYFFEALRKALHGNGDLLYSWARSLGGEFTGIYAYYLASPLSYLVFFFSETHITEALLLIHLLKCGIAGCSLSIYLKKTQPQIRDLWIILFSTMYALSGYVIAFGHNTMWMDALMLLPLVIYGVEKIVKYQKSTLFIVTMTLTLLSTFYIGYMVCIFVLLYFFYYYFSFSGEYKNNYYGERFHFIKSLIRMGIAAALSIAMAMVILLPTYYSLSFGKTTFSGADIDYTSLTSILNYFKEMDITNQFDVIDSLSKMLPGGYDTVRPDGLPFLYAGMLCLFCLPLFFLSTKERIREKVGAGIMLVLMMMTMQNNITDLIWHCFQRPNWLNYRYSFIFIFLLVIFACRGAQYLDDAKGGQIGAIGGGLLGLIVLLQSQNLEIKIDKISYDLYCIWLSVILAICYMGILGAYLKPRLKQAATVLIAAFVCGEALLSGTIYLIALDYDVVISTRTSYVSFINRVNGTVYKIQDEDQSFYRMEKTLFRNVCDNMALNMRGVSNSTSTLNASTIKFLNQMGYSAESHWTVYKGGTPVNDSLIGMKYVVYDDLNKVPTVYEPYLSDNANNVWAYKNPNALSLAFAANSAINKIDMKDYATPFEAMNAMITAMLGSKEPVEVFKAVNCDVFPNPDNVLVTGSRPGNQQDGKNYYYSYYQKLDTSIDYMSDIRFILTLPEDMPSGSNLYMFFPSDYPRAMTWKFITGTGEDRTGFFFDGENNCIQYLGAVQQGEHRYALEATITSDDNMLYLIDDDDVHSFWYLDEAVYNEAMAKLAEGNFIIDEDYKESHFTGKINVPEGATTVFTSIPYDAGWNIYVDGEKVETQKTLDALVAFDITPGEHTLELRYFSDYHKWGVIISLCALGITLLYLFIDYKFVRPRLPKKRKLLEEKLEWIAKREAEALEIEAAKAEETADIITAQADTQKMLPADDTKPSDENITN